MAEKVEGATSAEQIVLDMFKRLEPIADEFVTIITSKDNKITELEDKVGKLIENNQVLFQKEHESKALYDKEKEKNDKLTEKYLQIKRSYRANFNVCQQFVKHFKKPRLPLSDDEGADNSGK
jgi:regulator of replication initiation timing